MTSLFPRIIFDHWLEFLMFELCGFKNFFLLMCDGQADKWTDRQTDRQTPRRPYGMALGEVKFR